jgi:signal transduction histidine kinase/CheY-like chemotaxis protein
MSAASSERALILAPRGRDAPTASRILRVAGIASLACADVEHLCREIEAGAGVVLLTTEALQGDAQALLSELLARQASWSELPLIVFSAPELGGATPPLAQIGEKAHVTVVDRPIRVKTLISAVRSAIRSRKRQYEVRRLMDELEGRVRERDKFLAILGHELRNPLAAILLASQMRDPKDGRLDAEHAVLIARQSRQLTRLVDDLLELSRVTEGKIVLQLEPVDLQEVVEQSLGTLWDVAREHGVLLQLRASGGGVFVQGDPMRLEQIIGNLLTNAVKYTSTGGRVDVYVERDGGAAILRVKDTGVGIEPLRIDRIFGLFTQAENTIGRSQGGMGIGLSLVRSLVELHGGSVAARSDGIGMGSEFTVRLPAVKRGQRPVPPPVVAPAPPEVRPGFEVVIIEDNPDVRQLLQLKLRRLGHTADGVRDGEEGIERIVHRPPALALVDLGLPGVDGYEVAHQVRARVGGAVYLVALSGFGQPEDKRRALEAGFDEHLTKPADPRTLEGVLDRVRRRVA